PHGVQHALGADLQPERWTLDPVRNAGRELRRVETAVAPAAELQIEHPVPGRPCPAQRRPRATRPSLEVLIRPPVRRDRSRDALLFVVEGCEQARTMANRAVDGPRGGIAPRQIEEVAHRFAMVLTAAELDVRLEILRREPISGGAGA